MNDRPSDQPETEPRGLGCTAVVILLERIAVALERIANMPPTSPSKPGEFMKWAIENGLPNDVRVRKVMSWADVRSLDEVTVKAFTGRGNCGKLTIEKIMRWKESIAK